MRLRVGRGDDGQEPIIQGRCCRLDTTLSEIITAMGALSLVSHGPIDRRCGH